MSTSKILSKNLLKLASLKAVVSRGLDTWRAAETLEDQLVVESKLLNKYQYLVDNELGLPVTQFDSPDRQQINDRYDRLANLNVSTRAKYSVVADSYLNKYNNSKLMLQDLSNQVKRIKQKHATLTLTNTKFKKYVTGNNFNSTGLIDYGFCSGANAEVDALAGIAHLPKTLTESKLPNNIVLSSESNGAAGSSDATVDSSNQNVSVLLNSNNTNSFYYEKIQSGPCKLGLIFQFSKPTLINNIVANLEINEDGLAPEVSRISFITSNNQSIDFRDLTSQTINSVTNSDEQIGIVFPPIEVVGVHVLFLQNSSIQINTATNRTVKQFLIAIKSVEFFLNQYSAEGMIGSKSIDLPSGLFAFEPFIEYYPNSNEFFDLKLETSFDNGATWKQVATEESVDISLVSGRSFLWRLGLKRQDEAFGSFSSFLPDSLITGKKKFLQRVINLNTSPYVLSLTSKPKGQDDIYVWQPKVFRRGDIDTAVKLGVVGSIQTKLKLPFDTSLIDSSELSISIGSNELTYVTPGTAMASAQWTYSDGRKSVLLSGYISNNSVVYGHLEPEQMFLEDTSEGYLARPKFAFDTDKDRITLKAMDSKLARRSFVLPNIQTTIYLGVKNINSDSIEFTSSAGTTWTEGVSEVAIVGQTNQYYLDASNGILHLSNVVGSDNVSISYQYYADKTLDNDSYEIYYDNAKPIGFLINKKSLPVQTIRETIGNNILEALNPISGSHTQRTNYFPSSSKHKQFGYKNLIANSLEIKKDLLANGLIPEEVPYIDGKSEFLGLVKVDREFTNEQEGAGSQGLCTFYLAARSLWYRDFGVNFSSSYFSTRVSPGSSLAVGEYYIQNDGLVVVRVGAGNTLPADIVYSYYYRGEDIDPENKVSVDYENGILYSYSNLNSSAKVKYSVCPLLAHYDIVADVDFDYNASSNQLEINTLKMNPINNQLKVSWIEAPYDLSTATIKENFTPVVSRVGFRFN